MIKSKPTKKAARTDQNLVKTKLKKKMTAVPQRKTRAVKAIKRVIKI